MKDKNRSAVELYDLIAEDYAKHFDGGSSDEDSRFLNAFVNYLKPRSSTIDMGCGTGYATNYFMEHGMNSIGVDLSKGMLGVARRKYPKLMFVEADVRTYRPPSEVDAVWAGYSLFHFERPDFEKTLQKVNSYLKDGGMIGLVMQEGRGEVDQSEPLAPDQSAYIRLYEESELKAILSDHGFEIVEVKRKPPIRKKELPFNKLMIIGRNYRDRE